MESRHTCHPHSTITDSFDVGFGVNEWHGTNAFFRDDDDDNIFRLSQPVERNDAGGTRLIADVKACATPSTMCTSCRARPLSRSRVGST